MSDRGWIEPIVERVVGQVLDSHAAQLRGEIVRRVMEEIAAQPAEPAAPKASSAADLARALSEIQVGTSQKEILRALLDSSSQFAARVALFVVKGNHATGWQARGFASSDTLKDFTLDSNAVAVSRAITDRVSGTIATGEFDGRFFEQFGTPTSDANLLPLILKDKVAALVYADAGNDGKLDAGALEVLVLATGSWLEVNALRKQVLKEPHASAAQESTNASAAQAPGAAAPAFNDPFASHAPAFAMAAAASSGGQATNVVAAPEPASENLPPAVFAGGDSPTEVQSTATQAIETAEPLVVGHVQSDVPAEVALPAATISAEDQEVHRKAQRFARLLVDEIKLYNQAKVSEGRSKNDLYDRLKDTIEKSRTTYQKRYGNTVAASGNYFQHEVIRSLAEDDLKIMGPNFKL